MRGIVFFVGDGPIKEVHRQKEKKILIDPPSVGNVLINLPPPSH